MMRAGNMGGFVPVGGSFMVVSTVSTPPHGAPTQVGARVPTELQQRTIQLLARLAVNWGVTQARRSDPGPSSQAGAHALLHRPV